MPAEYLVYFGTFTDGSSRGIYVSRMDAETGSLTTPELAAEVSSPNFLAVSPDERFLFAASRPNAAEGIIDSYLILRPSGRLERSGRLSAGGAGPCHVSVDARGRAVLVANYTSGSVKSFLAGAWGQLSDGTLITLAGSSVHPSRQTGPHAHSILPAPGGRFALACDLGTDRVMIYRLDPDDASLVANDPAFATVPPGSGPRHLVFSPDGTRVYVVNEMACTVSSFAWDPSRGSLDPLETVAILPPDVTVEASMTAAAIVVSPDGRYVYATVRGHDSVSVLAVAREGGALSLVENVPGGGRIPRGLGIDPTGRWLLVGNQGSDSVAVFEIEGATGRLAPTAHFASVGAPVDIKFVRAGDR